MEPICVSPNNIPHDYSNSVEVYESAMREDVNEEDEALNMLNTFDKNRDGVLDFEEFSNLLQHIFQLGPIDMTSEEKLKSFMLLLDLNNDGVIDRTEFQHAWTHCFDKILHPVTALIIVDVQNDFIDGSLALRHCPAQQDGAEVVPVINRLLEEREFDLVVYSMDWHPDTHISFIDNVHMYPLDKGCTKRFDECCTYDEVTFDLSPPRTQVLWPAHCIQDSEGAKLASNLKVSPGAVRIYKGTNPDIDSYSAFFDNMRLSQTSLQEELEKRHVTDVYICGLAYDVCVAATGVDAVGLGYRTVIVNDACRGVMEDKIKEEKEKLQEQGALVLESDEAMKLLANKARPNFDLGCFTAKTMPPFAST
ncbi:uncharacterized protein [Watersipora subatra]|uniref:uncharacterized protein n=1 Tax=Watersipora subatra TaxID=2589382 RepID=UPI00355B5B37